MSLIAFILVGISAFTHALWNFISKRQNPPAAFFLLASVGTIVLFSPVLFFFREGLIEIPPVVWRLIILTGLIQAIYYIFLAAAYRNGDLSLAYPFARSLPVVIIAFVTVLLGRGDQIRPWAYGGFALVSTGCIILPLSGFRNISKDSYRQKWMVFAFLAAICIAGYMLIDDQSLRVLRSLNNPQFPPLAWAILYAELESISLASFLFVLLLFSGVERNKLKTTGISDWRLALRMGFIICSTYILVLYSMAFVENVSYVTAFRQLSIPIGAVMGILIRKEKASAPKLIGIALVISGLVLSVLA